MSVMDWTDDQKTAFTSNKPDILVSAAAGSGKTAVLTQRLINKIINEDLDVSKIIVVTFTEEAANQLKAKIRDRILRELTDKPNNKHLKKQYINLPNAMISTIHSFCLSIVRQNYVKLDLSPNVSVCDETQSLILQEQVADAVIDSYYNAIPGYTDIEDFVTFADNFITLYDTSLTKNLLNIYNKISSMPEGIEFLKKCISEYEIAEKDFNSSLWGKYLIQHTKDMLDFYLSIFNDACIKFTDGDVFQKNYLPAFKSALDLCNSLIICINEGDICEYLSCVSSFKKINLGRGVSKEDQDSKTEFFKQKRDDFYKELSTLNEKFFYISQEEISLTAVKTKVFLDGLYKLLSAFNNRFLSEKKKRNIIDFNDFERMAYTLLVNQDGTPTETAIKFGKNYSEIYIDEYQDVNYIQDRIFNAISRNSNRFMVGDIKQSIYGFRGSMPEIFASYRTGGNVEVISLSNNFRCDQPIIDFTNEVCGNLFTKYGFTFPYENSDRLVYSKKEGSANPVKLKIIDTLPKAEGNEQKPRYSSEIQYIANSIYTDIKNGKRASEIAVISRTKSKFEDIESALNEYGIKTKNADSRDLFVNPEVVLLMSLLNTIDNPEKEIFLTGTLVSPIFGFNLSELTYIRSLFPQASLYTAIKKYAEEHNDEKCNRFLNKLNGYIKLTNLPVDKLIWHILCDSGLIYIAKKNDKENGKRNLMALYDYARSFENGTFKGLYNFIRYINEIIQNGGTLPSPKTSSDDEYVNIMTIHKSKGLEFDTVYLVNTNPVKSGNKNNGNVIISSELGASLKLSDETGMASYDTVFRNISTLQIQKKEYDEEIRNLYVALTRAKSNLIITGTVSKKDELETLKYIKRYTKFGHGYAYYQMNKLMQWICMSQDATTPEIIDPLTVKTHDEVLNSKITIIKDDGNIKTSERDEETIKKYKDVMREKIKPYISEITIPAKLSVSQLYPSVLDDYDDSANINTPTNAKLKVPSFIQKRQRSGTDIGTATHQFMQFCSFENLKEYSVEHEISRLKNKGFIDENTASLISISSVKSFILSDLFAELLNCSFIERELRFNVKLGASSFTTDQRTKEKLKDEFVLVQGIIDCLFRDKNGIITVLDYKTDNIPSNMTESEATELLIRRHRQQLSYYKEAAKIITDESTVNVVLYSFSLGKSIKLKNKDLIEF